MSRAEIKTLAKHLNAMEALFEAGLAEVDKARQLLTELAAPAASGKKPNTLTTAQIQQLKSGLRSKMLTKKIA